jgi:hypothetical protein
MSEVNTKRTAKSEPKTINFSDFIKQYGVMDNQGRIDVQATHIKFTSDLTNFERGAQDEGNVIADAVRGVFAERNYETVGLSALIYYTMEKLSFDDNNFNQVRNKVISYIRGNKATFKVGKGAKGGVSWTDEADSDFQVKNTMRANSNSMPVPSSVPSPSISVSDAPPSRSPSSISLRPRHNHA